MLLADTKYLAIRFLGRVCLGLFSRHRPFSATGLISQIDLPFMGSSCPPIIFCLHS